MNDPGFAAVKREIVASGQASTGSNLDGMLMDFDAYLEMSDLVEDRSVSIETTDDVSSLLLATCVAKAGADADDVIRELARIWESSLRYHEGPGAYEVKHDGSRVIFDFVTQMAPGRSFVTGRITVGIP